MSSYDENLLCFVDDSPVHGCGLFARDTILAGTWIGYYDGPRTEENGTHVLWVDNGEADEEEWVGYNGDNELRFLNHAAIPNGEMDGRDLYATRDININEEITIDYGEEFNAGL